MDKLESFSQLSEYCLRRLGKPVIEIEIEEQQIKDRINDAIQMFQTRHYDGVEERTLKKYITYNDEINGYLTLDDFDSITNMLSIEDSTANIDDFYDIEFRFHEEYLAGVNKTMGNHMLTDYYISMEYLQSMKFLLTVDKSFSYNGMTHKFYPSGTLSSRYTGNLITNFVSDDWIEINATLTNDDKELPSGDLKGSTVTAISDDIFSIENTYVTKSYTRGLYTGKVSLMSGSYTGTINLKLYDRNDNLINSKTVQPENYWKTFYIEGTTVAGNINDIKMVIETSTAGVINNDFFVYYPDLYKNNFIFLSGYIAADSETFDFIWDVWFVKELATAFLKRQWGSNLKKYDGIQLSGGVTLNGQTIWDEGNAAIEKLEEDLELKYSMPIDFMVG